MAEDLRMRVRRQASGTITGIVHGDVVTVEVNGVAAKTLTIPSVPAGFTQGKLEVSVRCVLGVDTSAMTAAQRSTLMTKLADSDGTFEQTQETSS